MLNPTPPREQKAAASALETYVHNLRKYCSGYSCQWRHNGMFFSVYYHSCPRVSCLSPTLSFILCVMVRYKKTFCLKLPVPSALPLLLYSSHPYLLFQVTIISGLTLLLVWPFCEGFKYFCGSSDAEQLWFPRRSPHLHHHSFFCFRFGTPAVPSPSSDLSTLSLRWLPPPFHTLAANQNQ